MAKEKLELSAIQEAIASSNAGWEASITSVSELTDAEKKILLGYTPGPGDPSLEQQEQAGAAALSEYLSAARSLDSFGAPASIDWRNNGGNFVTDVKNQGSCGSCVAFGTIASVESQIKILRGATFAINLSEAHLFIVMQDQRIEIVAMVGGLIKLSTFFQTQGVTEDAYYPYTAGDQNCSGKLAGWDSHLTKITGYTKINGIEAIKEYVATKGPVEACFSVYNDFYNYRTGVYRYTTGALLGGHCVCIVGYNTAGGYWICKNSWGTGFGESGFFKIAFGQCGIEGQVYGPSGIVNNYNVNGVKIQGLWAINETRNAWVFVSGGHGWKKIGNLNDSAFLNLTTQLASAKITNSNVNLIIKDSLIQQVYVF